MKVIKVILCIIAAILLIVGIPIIINECYKANYGYITVRDGADVLGYYGAILGSIIAVATLAITIVFTKKQIQRDSFLKNENEKWDRLKAIFLQTLSDINPMRVLKDVMDNGITDPTKAINLLQRYRPLVEFCVSEFRQTQEYHVINVHDGGLFPLSTDFLVG